jgi:hypothetical protein
MASTKTTLLIVTGLLAPGGVLLLAWLLCRRLRNGIVR